MGKRKLELDLLEPRKQQKLDMLNDSNKQFHESSNRSEPICHNSIDVNYIESVTEPIFMTLSPNNQDSVNVCKSSNVQIDAKETKLDTFDLDLLKHSLQDNVQLLSNSNGNDLSSIAEQLKEPNMKKSPIDSNILIDDQAVETCINMFKFPNVFSSKFEKEISMSNVDHKLVKNESLFEAKCDRSVKNEVKLLEIYQETLNSCEACAMKHEMRDVLSCQSAVCSGSQLKTKCPVGNRLTCSDSSTEQTRRIISGRTRIDPWSVPEIYFDSIEIEIVVCKRRLPLEKRKSRLEKCKNNITSKDDKLNDINKSVNGSNLFKPYLIQPGLSLDNCLPMDIVSAPCVQYAVDDCKQLMVGEKSSYFSNLLSDMKFNEAFLQNSFTNDSSFYDLLGINLFDTGIDLSRENYCENDVKTEFNKCPICLLNIYHSLFCDDDLKLSHKNTETCKCNRKAFKCYKNRNKSKRMRPMNVNGICKSELFLKHYDKFNQSVEQNSATKFNRLTNSIDITSQLSSETLSYSKNIEKPFNYKRYGDLHKSPEYFEDLDTSEDHTQSLHFNCQYSLYNFKDCSIPTKDITHNKRHSYNSLIPKVDNLKFKVSYDTNTCETDKVKNAILQCKKYKANLKPHGKVVNKKRKQFPKLEDLQLSIEKQMIENPRKTLNETGWILSACNPLINCTLNSDCPTLIPFSLKDQYFNSAPAMVAWKFEKSIAESSPNSKKKKLSKEPITLKNKLIKKATLFNADKMRLLSKPRPINVINNLNTTEKLHSRPQQSALVRHFGDILNRMPRLGIDSKKEFQYLSKST